MKITQSGDVTIIVAADDQTKEAIEAAKKRLGELGTHTESTLSKMKSQWLAIVGVLVTVKKAYDWAQEAANYQAQMNQMDALARKHNETAESMLNDLRKITEGEITNADLVAVSAESMLKQLKPDQIKEFAKYADGLAKTLGIDDVAAFRAMTDAAISGKGAWKLGAMEAKDLDAVLGSQVNTMSDTEKAQARVTVMLRLMKQEFQQTSQEVKAASDIYDQVNAKFSNMWMSIKNFIAKYGVLVVAGWGLIISVFDRGISNILYGAERLLNFASRLPGGKTLITRLLGENAAQDIGNLGQSFSSSAYKMEKFAMKAYESWQNYDKFSGSVKNSSGHIQKNQAAIDAAALAHANWTAKVEALNPFIDEEDKKVISLNKSMFELTQKYPKAAWVAEEYAKALTYIDYAESMKQNEARKKLIDEENEYRFQKYAETLKKLEELDKQYIEIKKTQYEQSWKGIMDMINQTGGEQGAALGQAASSMKGLSDVSAGIDPYSQQIDALSQYYADKTTVMEQQMQYELYCMEQRDATELEREEYKRAALAAINDQWNQYEIEQEQIKNRQKIQQTADVAGAMAGIANALYIASDKQNKTAFAAWKAFSIARALISTYLAAAEALAFPPGPPISLIYVAMAIAAGMAQVMAIMKTQPGGTTASTSVSGGGGYSYSNSNASQWESSEASKQVSSKSVEIHIHGNVVDHAAFVRELAPYISEAKGDKVSYGE